MEDLRLHGLLGGGGSNIKSIQRGITKITSPTHNVTIAEVDLNKAILIMSFDPISTGSSDKSVGGKLTTSTNIQFLCKLEYNQAVSWQVIEFNNVKSVQRGSVSGIDLGNGETFNITSIDTTKSFLVFNYRLDASGTAVLGYPCRGQITTSTTIEFQSGFGALTDAVEWEVIEFN